VLNLNGEPLTVEVVYNFPGWDELGEQLNQENSASLGSGKFLKRSRHGPYGAFRCCHGGKAKPVFDFSSLSASQHSDDDHAASSAQSSKRWKKVDCKHSASFKKVSGGFIFTGTCCSEHSGHTAYKGTAVIRLTAAQRDQIIETVIEQDLPFHSTLTLAEKTVGGFVDKTQVKNLRALAKRRKTHASIQTIAEALLKMGLDQERVNAVSSSPVTTRCVASHAREHGQKDSHELLK
jgi:hypothetical protein